MTDFELKCEGCGTLLTWDERIFTRCKCTQREQVLRAVRAGFLNKRRIARATRYKLASVGATLVALYAEGYIARVGDEHRPAGSRGKFPYDYYIRDSPQDPKYFNYAVRYAALLSGELPW